MWKVEGGCTAKSVRWSVGAFCAKGLPPTQQRQQDNQQYLIVAISLIRYTDMYAGMMIYKHSKKAGMMQHYRDQLWGNICEFFIFWLLFFFGCPFCFYHIPLSPDGPSHIVAITMIITISTLQQCDAALLTLYSCPPCFPFPFTRLPADPQPPFACGP